MYRNCFKRLIDLALSFLALVILAIPMLIFAILIKLDSRGPVLFWQKRVGLHKQNFMMPKFRSMYTETPSDMPTHLLNDPDRWITPVGRIYRKLSIDEVLEAHANGKLDEAFGTGTAAVISPIGELFDNGKTYTVNNGEIGAIAQKLYDTLYGMQTGVVEDFMGWTYPLGFKA